MTLPETVRLLLIAARSIGFAGAALTVALMVWWGQDLLRYAFFSEDPTWGEVGVIPFVVALRAIVAVWVVWSVVKLDGRGLLRVLLAAFGISFFLLYGWYFLLTGMDWGFLYLTAGGDFLYLIGGIACGWALRLTRISTRPGDAPT